MKNLFKNLMPEDTRSSDAAGGSLWTVGRLQAFFIFNPHGIGMIGRKGRPWPLPVDKPGRK